MFNIYSRDVPTDVGPDVHGTYEKKSLTLDLGLNRRLQWLFCIEDVGYAI
ncbi:hypothetical protein HPB50_004630 [Hyalomma asiaticum]|uniref:Uncharacterized protein n=1 Tax=Hyalomma asiaticum TaxID=266040 RepID=A0ACB7TCK2_HYAAI|nr:hypothetical protein HPB50_004630 [Hyalomma asiaticum]